MTKPIKNLQLFNDLCAVEEVLIERGWCKGKSSDDNGRVCLMKATSVVVCPNKGHPDNYYRLVALDETLRSTIGQDPVIFNDDPDTTFDDVLTKLREAREALITS